MIIRRRIKAIKILIAEIMVVVIIVMVSVKITTDRFLPGVFRLLQLGRSHSGAAWQGRYTGELRICDNH